MRRAHSVVGFGKTFQDYFAMRVLLKALKSLKPKPPPCLDIISLKPTNPVISFLIAIHITPPKLFEV